MTSRERISRALKHEQPDCVPVDFGAMNSTGIAGVAYVRLRKHLGLDDKLIKVYNLPCQLAEVDTDVLEKTGGDARPVRTPVEGWKEDSLSDGTECLIDARWTVRTFEDGSRAEVDREGNIGYQMPSGGLYFDNLREKPLARATTVREIEKYPIIADEVDKTALRREAKALFEETDCFIAGDFYCSVFEKAWEYRGMTEFLMDLSQDGSMAECLLDKILEREMRTVGPQLEACRGFIQAMTTSDDLGTQTSLMFSPWTYRRFIKPRQKRLYEFMKSICDVPLILHSCGNMYELIPDLIEIGVDALNPVQVSCPDMSDTKKLKREFGADLAFWGGGCDTREVLPGGSIREIRDEVKRRIEDLSGSGGFVFCPVHNIQADTAPENIMAMFEAVREVG